MFARTPDGGAYEPSKSFPRPPTDKKANPPASSTSKTDASDIERRLAEFIEGKNAAHAALLASKERDPDEVEEEETKGSRGHSANVRPQETDPGLSPAFPGHSDAMSAGPLSGDSAPASLRGAR